VNLDLSEEEEGWLEWYRVQEVAFKELAYRIMGIEDEVLWLIPEYDNVTTGIVEDDDFIVFGITRGEPLLTRLYNAMMLDFNNFFEFRNNLSPRIDLKRYDRDLDGQNIEEQFFRPYGVNGNLADRNERAVSYGDNYVIYYGELGEVYVSKNGFFVRESKWRNENLLLIQEYCTDVASRLLEDGIIDSLAEVNA
jgi:hypothetical protein